MELNEKIIMETVENKINKLYIESVLSESTIAVIHGLSMGYRICEIVRYLNDQGIPLTANAANVIKFRYKGLINEAKKEFNDLVRIHNNQQKVKAKERG